MTHVFSHTCPRLVARWFSFCMKRYGTDDGLSKQESLQAYSLFCNRVLALPRLPTAPRMHGIWVDSVQAMKREREYTN